MVGSDVVQHACWGSVSFADEIELAVILVLQGARVIIYFEDRDETRPLQRDQFETLSTDPGCPGRI